MKLLGSVTIPASMDDNKPKTNELASQIMGEIKPNEDGSREVAILIIIAIIGLLIQVYQCWKNNHKAAAICRDPGWRHKVMLHYCIRRCMGRDLYKRKGEETAAAFLKLGKDATPEAIAKLLEENGG
jgi:hypothetical protein